MRPALRTAHGELVFPAYFPDGTRGVIRSLGGEDLARCGTQGVMVNVFHLLARPGTRRIEALGGIHSFMNWQGPVAADSGGFQAYSLLDGSPGLGVITRKGFAYRMQKGGARRLLTPQKCIEAQFRLGADLMFCLDYCTHPGAPEQVQRESVELTLAWARQCRVTYDRLVEGKRLAPEERPALLAVVQGGEDPALRRACAAALVEIGFDGYAFGGWPVTEDGRLSETVALVAELVPDDKPRFGLGIGKPENLVKAFRWGYDLFDCVIPTRDARHRRLYVFSAPPESATLEGEGFYHCLYMQDETHRRDSRPVEDGCDCDCCRHYSRAYLHHLFGIGDSLAERLATIHNLRFYRRLVAALGARAADGRAEG